jgi:RNA polymerase sigma-70 factor (ECF subfamily)
MYTGPWNPTFFLRCVPRSGLTAVSTLDSDSLFQAVYSRARRYALRHLDGDRAEDLAHEVAANFERRRDEGGAIPAAERELNALIYRAVINRLIDTKRANERRTTAERVYATDLLERAMEWSNPDSILEAHELAMIMRDTIAAMPPRMRHIFLLVRDHDQTYQEVADALDIGAGTVHTQISRAYALLRESINRYRAGGDGDHSGSSEEAATSDRRTKQ